MSCDILNVATFQEEFLNTKGIKDRAERKAKKRAARKKRPPLAKSTADRGSQKRKVRKKGPGTAKRR